MTPEQRLVRAHLSASEIAAELRCSRRHAQDLMREMRPLDIGGGRLRVAREDFEEWQARKRDVEAAKTSSGSAAASGGRTLGASVSRRAAQIAKRRVSLVDVSSERPPIRLTQPRARKASAT